MNGFLIHWFLDNSTLVFFLTYWFLHNVNSSLWVKPFFMEKMTFLDELQILSFNISKLVKNVFIGSYLHCTYLLLNV